MRKILDHLLENCVLNAVSRHRLHLLHCTVFLVLIYTLAFVEVTTQDFRVNSWRTCGILSTCLMYTISLLPLVNLCSSVCTFLGLFLYDSFHDEVELTNPSLHDAPFICLRIVTKGDYPKLIEENVRKNLKACQDLGMVNYLIEVVTQKRLELPKHPKLREVLVPSSYKTKNGALYKGRNLQYCLETDCNILKDEDWVLHLDEDGICSVDCLKGVLNFARDNRHPFGQGYVELDTEQISVFPTQILNVWRLLMDLGYGKFQFKYLNNCFFGWKGSYMLCKVGAEKQVGFDGGFKGSITENAYFAMKATEMGYSFGWVDGNMIELGPLTVKDFVAQQCRIIQGLSLCLQCDFSFKTKFSMYLFVVCLLSSPIVLLDLLVTKLYPLPIPTVIVVLKSFILAVNLHGFVFWAMKRYKNGREFHFLKELIISLVLGLPLKIIVGNYVFFKWIVELGCDIQFKITKKD